MGTKLLVSDDSVPMHRVFERKLVELVPRYIMAMAMSAVEWPPSIPVLGNWYLTGL